MRLIKITDYDEHTMRLAKPIYDSQRRILLAANSAIHPKFLSRLIDLGISHLIVDDAVSKGISLEEMLDIPSWVDIIYSLKIIYQDISGKRPFPLKLVQTMTNQLLHEVKRKQFIIQVPASTIPIDLREYAHAVNVTLLSLQIGKQIGYNEFQLRDLAVGCLFHDVGKTISNDDKHPEHGFNLLRRIQEINLMSAHIAFQHHETLDGKGYPRRIEGKTIIEYAQVCGVANLFDNKVSHQDMPPHEAMEFIMALNGIAYSEHIVHAFIHSVPPYPPGTKVRLHNGELGIVTRIRSHLHRPDVRLLSSEQEISLADHPSLMIAGMEI